MESAKLNLPPRSGILELSEECEQGRSSGLASLDQVYSPPRYPPRSSAQPRLTPNPYESTASPSAPRPQRRAVCRYVAAFGMAVSVGAVVAIPGAVLVNQEWQIVPTSVYSSDFEINGRRVSNATVIGYSFLTAGLLISSGAVSALVGFRNWRANNRTWAEWTR